MIQPYYDIDYIPYVVCYITWLIYFIASSLYLLTPFTYFSQPTTLLPSGNNQLVLCIYKSDSVLYVFFFFLDSSIIFQIIWYLLYLSGISLNIIPCRSIHIEQMALFHIFNEWVEFLQTCTYRHTPHLLYPWASCHVSVSHLYVFLRRKRHRCTEQTFGLCRRRRGRDVLREYHWNKHTIKGETDHQLRLDAWDRCSGLVHWEDPEGCKGEGMGGGIGMGNT